MVLNGNIKGKNMKIKYFLLYSLYLLLGCFIIHAVCILIDAPAIAHYILAIPLGILLGYWLGNKTIE